MRIFLKMECALKECGLGTQEWVSLGILADILPLTLLLWDVNVRVAKIAAWGLASMVVASKTQWTQLKLTSSRRNGMLSDLDPV